ncbi:MAG: hypothetical protein M1608_02800 [Candidatus Omnitrophica bacterium]|nr:hypothetical protein [Candidatus Omnitrophota bacterium]
MDTTPFFVELTDWSPVNPDLTLGRVFVERTLLQRIKPEHLHHALQSHAIGNWGLVPMAIAKLNGEASEHGGPILSLFNVQDVTRFVVVTKGNPPRTEVTGW